MIKRVLDEKKSLQKHLFENGFLIIDKDMSPDDKFPFYNNWDRKVVGKFTFIIYNSVSDFYYENEHGTFFIIGHAYDPYKMISDENIIIKNIADAYKTGKYLEEINEITGIFLLGVIKKSGDAEFFVDASGLQYCCYGKVGGHICVASHMRLLGDIFDIREDAYVTRLVDYKWYNYVMGKYLPGDITCYKEIKRLVPNTYVTCNDGEFDIIRFYPEKEINMCGTDEEYNSVIEKASELFENTMSLICEKWNRPAISLTGGIDSNTTFAAANKLYDKIEAFSYVSMPREAVDSEKAKEICKRFDVRHSEYLITENNDDIDNFDVYKLIFEHNGGDIGRCDDTDSRKKIVLINSDVCDVEVKSWVSETIRGYAYKYYGKKKFPKSLSARNYTSLYKVFFMNRRLVWDTDKCFKDYWKRTKLKEKIYNYDETDLFVWEMHGGKEGLNLGVMRSCFDITVPYNNRKLLDLLLSVPIEYRISDKLHLDIKKRLNKELFEMNIRVVNLNQTKKRSKIAGMYFDINSFLPF